MRTGDIIKIEKANISWITNTFVIQEECSRHYENELILISAQNADSISENNKKGDLNVCLQNS